MNKKQLMALGIPEDCVPAAISCIHQAAEDHLLRELKPKRVIPEVVANPESYLGDPVLGGLAQAIVDHFAMEFDKPPIPYRQWGEDIDAASKQQMRDACSLPIAYAAALMPDAHVGYGLPIGGVLACENAVVPYAVGVDIACRMRLTITDLPVDRLVKNDSADCQSLDLALQQGTRFGTGRVWERPFDHDVLDEDWTVTAVTREMRDTARKQLGTSGSGNHFVEWGIVALPADDLGLAAGRYVALLSHSGSRGAGARVCQRYTDIAQRKLPARFRNDKRLKHLAWLTMDGEDGQEYWQAMNLMGRYAAANHEVIHRNVTRLAGAAALSTIENHHNFAWQEEYQGKTVVVHRKGATPAGMGVLGVIPGSMADPAYLVRGRGNVASLNSASHGAGRRMSRTAAKNEFRWNPWHEHLAKKNVRLLAGGLDEVPGAYKDIREVMAAQRDLVDIVGTFEPRIVMMCGDGSRAED
ncbi:MAG: RtcB family protein [Planctomycetota bacterium]|nr:RtcB family protein [Planctomycetota bacterium]